MPLWCNPVGNTSIREYPPAPWSITNRILATYKLNGSQAVHTGDDINLPDGKDIGEVVRAIGKGIVTYASKEASTWIGLVVIRHNHNNTFTFSRYAHLTDIEVKEGDEVDVGQLIGKISDTVGIADFPPHLHFDIGKTGNILLEHTPRHWPKKDVSLEERRNNVWENYQDPGSFLKPRLAMNESTIEDLTVPTIKMRVDIEFVNVRSQRFISDETFVQRVLKNDILLVSASTVQTKNITWRQIIEPSHLAGHFVAERIHPSIDPRIYLVAIETNEFNTLTLKIVEIESQKPAPLTGQFRLVADKSQAGPCTSLAVFGSTQPTLGVNLREFVYYGSAHFPHTQKSDQARYCESVRDMGMRWIRFYAAHADFSDDEIVKRTKSALDMVAKHGLLGIIVFADSIGNMRFYPSHDAACHRGELRHLVKEYYIGRHYNNHYLPLVRRIVSDLHAHPGVGMWQLMNEPGIYSRPADDFSLDCNSSFSSQSPADAFARFVDTVSAEIYHIDKTHPISIGLINLAHISIQHKDAIEFYAKRRHIHVVSCHSYQDHKNMDDMAPWKFEEDALAADIKAAAATGRAVFWTEFGASHTGNRRTATERFLNRQLRTHRASAALQWAFMLAPDSGIGDRDFGFSDDVKVNKQFADLRQLYMDFKHALP